LTGARRRAFRSSVGTGTIEYVDGPGAGAFGRRTRLSQHTTIGEQPVRSTRVRGAFVLVAFSRVSCGSSAIDLGPEDHQNPDEAPNAR
jgi:hypothetical protein